MIMKSLVLWGGMWFVKVFMDGGGMECVKRAVAVEVESPPPELHAVEEPYRRIVEEVAAYVAERGRLEREKYKKLYRRFRELYPLPAQLIQQAINQGVEVGESFLEARRNGRVHKPRPEVGRVSIRFARESWSYKKVVGSAAPVKLALSLPGGIANAQHLSQFPVAYNHDELALYLRQALC